MSIVPLNSSDEKNISCSIQSFLLSFHVAQLLRKCGIAKIKGIPVMELFTYILSNVFRMGSFYMQKRVGNFTKSSRRTPTTAFSRMCTPTGSDSRHCSRSAS